MDAIYLSTFLPVTPTKHVACGAATSLPASSSCFLVAEMMQHMLGSMAGGPSGRGGVPPTMFPGLTDSLPFPAGAWCHMMCTHACKQAQCLAVYP